MATRIFVRRSRTAYGMAHKFGSVLENSIADKMAHLLSLNQNKKAEQTLPVIDLCDAKPVWKISIMRLFLETSEIYVERIIETIKDI